MSLTTVLTQLATMKKTAKKNTLVFAEDGQTYAQITKMLGHCRVMAQTESGEVMCKIRGSMQKRVYLSKGDWVLIAARENLAGDASDIIAKYDTDEVAYLKRIGEIKIEVAREDGNDDDGIVFEADDVNIDAV